MKEEERIGKLKASLESLIEDYLGDLSIVLCLITKPPVEYL